MYKCARGPDAILRNSLFHYYAALPMLCTRSLARNHRVHLRDYLFHASNQVHSDGTTSSDEFTLAALQAVMQAERAPLTLFSLRAPDQMNERLR